MEGVRAGDAQLRVGWLFGYGEAACIKDLSMCFSRGPFTPLLEPTPRRPSRMWTGTQDLDLHRRSSVIAQRRDNFSSRSFCYVNHGVLTQQDGLNDRNLM